jgi:hypothetical protein
MLCELVLITHLATIHTFTGYNDLTYGQGIGCQKDSLTVAVGMYRNSKWEPSHYATLHYSFGSLGVVGGVVDGYKGHTVLPLVGGSYSYAITPSWAISVVGFPHFGANSTAFHFTLIRRFR